MNIIDEEEDNKDNKEQYSQDYDDDWTKSYFDIYGEHCPNLNSKGNTINNNKDILNTSNYQPVIDVRDLRTKINYQDFIDYAINIIKKTVKCEDTLIKQIIYAALSSYIQNDPIN